MRNLKYKWINYIFFAFLFVTILKPKLVLCFYYDFISKNSLEIGISHITLNKKFKTSSLKFKTSPLFIYLNTTDYINIGSYSLIYSLKKNQGFGYHLFYISVDDSLVHNINEKLEDKGIKILNLQGSLNYNEIFYFYIKNLESINISSSISMLYLISDTTNNIGLKFSNGIYKDISIKKLNIQPYLGLDLEYIDGIKASLENFYYINFFHFNLLFGGIFSDFYIDVGKVYKFYFIPYIEIFINF